jgi:hypothetical protein
MVLDEEEDVSQERRPAASQSSPLSLRTSVVSLCDRCWSVHSHQLSRSQSPSAAYLDPGSRTGFRISTSLIDNVTITSAIKPPGFLANAIESRYECFGKGRTRHRLSFRDSPRHSLSFRSQA